MDAYGEMMTALRNTDIPFAEESWVSAPNTDYGVAALSGNRTEIYADDAPISVRCDAYVDLYTRDAGFRAGTAVEAALRSVEDADSQMVVREFLPEWKLTHYRWRVSLLMYEA